MDFSFDLESEDKTVFVFVRKGADDNERRLSFRLHDGMEPLDLLERGIALDGNEAAFTVWRNYHHDGEYWEFGGPFYEESQVMASSFTEALAIAQRELVKYLRERGFVPEFR